MNSFMAWVGGKKALRDEILNRFPPNYQKYIEVFGGAGWVLFHKETGRDFEVWNDRNSNLTNLYRCVRDNPNKVTSSPAYRGGGFLPQKRAVGSCSTVPVY